MSLHSAPTPARFLQSFIFASRWIQAPLYVGLIVAQLVYVWLFMVELSHLVSGALGPHKMTEADIMLIVLGLIDVVMIANLLIMVIVGGYETFVSRLELEDHPDQPEWLSHVNAGVLKIKLSTAIIGISSIHLLKSFINAGNLPEHTLYWQVAAIIGAVTGGWLADRWMRRTVRGRIYVSAIGMSLIVPAMFGVGYAPQTGLLGVAIAFLILFGLGWGFFDCNNMPILCQIARPELRATGYGIMNLVSISCGGLADWGFGILRDRQVPLFGIFGIFASAAVISVVLVLLIRPRDLDAPQRTSTP
ncbi:MAG TPA: TIGR00645 family protein [Azonexus sp.]|nr:TIGR00645 family protein [Azonexus sp.]